MSPRASRWTKLGLELAVPAAILGFWQLATTGNSQPAAKFPEFWLILVKFQKIFLFSQFGSEAVPSLERIGMGFGIAVVAALLIGIPVGLSEWARLTLLPHLEYWRNMPPPAMIPISVVLLHSIGNTQKVALIAFFCLYPILLNTIDGVRGIDPTLLDTARSYNMPRHQRIFRLVLPAASPQIAAGMRNAVALSVIVMVLAEYFSSTNGVGFILLNSKNTFQFPPMWAAMLMIGLFGFVLNALFLFLERRMLAWHRGWRAAAA